MVFQLILEAEGIITNKREVTHNLHLFQYHSIPQKVLHQVQLFFFITTELVDFNFLEAQK